jgi:hypothetical protein
MPSQALGASYGILARRQKPISSLTVVHEFSKEPIAELADMQSSHMWSKYSTLDPEPLSSFHCRLLEDARHSIVGLPNRPILKPTFLGSEVGYNDIPLYSGNLDSFDPFDALPHFKNWVPVRQRPLITYCRKRIITPRCLLTVSDRI